MPAKDCQDGAAEGGGLARRRVSPLLEEWKRGWGFPGDILLSAVQSGRGPTLEDLPRRSIFVLAHFPAGPRRSRRAGGEGGEKAQLYGVARYPPS